MYAVVVDLKLCKKCGICNAVCPKGVFGESGSVLNGRKCSGCRLCELYCPDFAIEVFRVGGDGVDSGE
jgi:2-oxoglutarate ferredoxin oxidoreductase subunit delta